MIKWFSQDAPIRTKFLTLLAVYALIAAIPLAASLYALADGGSPVVAGLSGIAVLAIAGVTLLARKLICDPYVSTVLRMEALAAGDTESPIEYTDFHDCVGRMTKAMAVFRDNALAVRKASSAQEVLVRALGTGIDHLARNDLTFRFERQFPEAYETLRHDFNRAMDAIADAISAVTASASAIANGSGEIHAASNDLSVRTEQQAASLEEASAAMSRVVATVQDNTRSAIEVTATINNTHERATENGQVVCEAVEAMAQIEDSSRAITQIIDVIDGIAFQTNLLALNAGVEAARAGDAGRGFAVVASEVRALAQRSAAAASDIKQLIDKSTTHVGRGVALVNSTGNGLRDIVNRVGEIRQVIAEIATNAEQQSLDLQQVSATVGDMDRMTQQNAAMVEESTAAAKGLATEAERLATLVGAFRLVEASGGVNVARFPGVPRVKPSPIAGHAVRQTVAIVNGGSAAEDWTEF